MSNPIPQTVTPVLNNREALIQLALPAKSGKGGMMPGGTIDLRPGINFPDTKMWEEAKKNELAAKLLTEKIQSSAAPEQTPERVGKPILEEGAPVSKDNPLASMKEGDAVALVDEMFDAVMMKRFLNQETRASVAAALKGQIAKIESPKAVEKRAAAR